jgi:coenzyme F420-0:L-glutamate ligase / coenzyme F420-1:gamma-L-glutamate ligase
VARIVRVEAIAGEGFDPEIIERRIANSDRILRTAPELLLPFVTLDGAHRYPDERRATAERDMFLLSGGAALANLQVVLTAHGVGAAWISSTLFCAATVRRCLDLDDAWQPLGMIAVGYPLQPPEPRRTVSTEGLLSER